MNFSDLQALPQTSPLRNPKVRQQLKKRQSYHEETMLAMESTEDSYAKSLEEFSHMSLFETPAYQPSLSTSPLAIPEIRQQIHRRKSELEERHLAMEGIEACYAEILSSSLEYDDHFHVAA
ncbi:hypothetical protein K493DRAFT_314433 [Basidiobolus meristosporus CBS 931.73]|uniref:Uncharacterized protein n=1 Tax=Basidiobolus meristosporus CBS 931.73 TaxID=1314790 RepID=A0A1Y1YEV4_9FUNG|nr:hypothetical protein K493DRAFT_314433 [Basidiobolus meristosporus CBS 931.73]|eukprot:ORX96561.1 hypothetical protein K493DRAFT_314433 [Basidiobolus meristosporus CBS 931.73]